MAGSKGSGSDKEADKRHNPPVGLPLEAEEVLKEQRRAAHRWQHMLKAIQDRVHEVPPDVPETHPWRAYASRLVEVVKRQKDAQADETEVKRVVVEGYMMLLFEKDPRNQEHALRLEVDRPVMFRSAEDITRAIEEREA